MKTHNQKPSFQLAKLLIISEYIYIGIADLTKFTMLFHAFIRIFDCIEDTFARKCKKKNTLSFAFYSLIRIFARRKKQEKDENK